jgi:hypothetical protein
MWKMVSAQSTAAKLLLAENLKKSEAPPSPVDHGPCNKAVDDLTEAIRDEIRDRRQIHNEEIREQQAFRIAFERWSAAESEYRRGRAVTGEFPVQR